MIALKRTRGLSGCAKAKEILRKKIGSAMSENAKLVCCNKKVFAGDLWILEDFKGYTKRKLFIGKCSVCGDDVCLQIMTNTVNNETYYNLYTGIEAVKTIYREKKRKLVTLPNIKANCLYGWVYGVNIEIKNKKGKVTQIRQYASDFKNQKTLIKSFSTEGY